MTVEYKSLGAMNKKEVSLKFLLPETEGIYLSFPDGSRISANAENIVSATRNTVLGIGNNRVCFVEHLLAAVHLLGIEKIEILIDGLEIPLEDGSAATWFNLLRDWKHKSQPESIISLKSSLFVCDERGNSIVAHSADKFKMTYLFESPVDKSRSWSNWTLDDGIEKLIEARTFASAMEHEMLGLKGKLISYDAKGFDLPLHSPDEPILHKMLDLFGDLSLSGINPLKLKAHFISFKGGHALNTQMAKLIKNHL